MNIRPLSDEFDMSKHMTVQILGAPLPRDAYEVNDESDPTDPYSGCDPFDIIAQRQEDNLRHHS